MEKSAYDPLILLLGFLTIGAHSQCIKHSGIVQTDVYIDNNQCLLTSALSIFDCAANCAVHTDCLSFGFESRTDSCHLHSVNSSTAPLNVKQNWLHSNINDWKKSITGPCADRSCTPNETCHVTRDTEASVCLAGTAPTTVVKSPPECPEPPHLPNTRHTDSFPDARIEEYTCNQGYMDITRDSNRTNITCMANGTWSSPNLNCYGPFIRIVTPRMAYAAFHPISDASLKNMTGNTSSLVFWVKTCHDANFELTTVPDKSGKEKKPFLCFGGWENTKTKIVEALFGGIDRTLSSAPTPALLNCDEFRPLWIDWSGGVISGGKGTELQKNVLVHWTIPGRLHVLKVGLGSYVDNTGTKQLFNPKF